MRAKTKSDYAEQLKILQSLIVKDMETNYETGQGSQWLEQNWQSLPESEQLRLLTLKLIFNLANKRIENIEKGRSE